MPARPTAGWCIFFGLELIAVIAWGTWEIFSSHTLWVTQFILLMPGNMTAAPFVEHLLWNTELSLNIIGIAELIAGLAVNAVVWAFILFLIAHSHKLFSRSRR